MFISRFYILLASCVLCSCLSGCGGAHDASSSSTPNGDGHSANTAATGVKLNDGVAHQMNFAAEVVKERVLGTDLHITGHLAPAVGKESDITTRFAGRVLEVKVKPGDYVKPGQILTVRDSHELSGLQAELIEANSKLSVALAHEEREKQVYVEYSQRPKGLTEARTRFEASKVHLELAESDFKRVEGLHREKIAAEKDYLAAHAALANAKLEFKDAQSAKQLEEGLFKNKALLRRDLQLAEAETQREKQHVQTLIQRLEGSGMNKEMIDQVIKTGKILLTLPVHARSAGYITFQDISVGELVGPDTHIFTITDLATVMVVADLPEVDLAGIKLGSPVKVRVPSFPNEVFHTQISYISDTVSPETRTVAIRALLDNRQRKLKVNMFADIELKASPRMVLSCPKSAVQERAGHKVVFVKEGSEYKERQVEVGLDNEHYYEVISGLKVGESVVTQGSLMLKTEMSKKH